MSSRFSELDVAEVWHIPPHLWDEMPEDSKAEMIARARAKSMMSRYEEHVNQRRNPPAQL